MPLIHSEDIGWKEIGETFIRYDLIKSRWFNIYLHRLIAVTAHEQCHSHPWWFVTLILSGGYNEFTNTTGWVFRPAGSILYRPASWTHNVTTAERGMWSLVLTGPKRHEWGFADCRAIS